jgi:hypothetical protein
MLNAEQIVLAGIGMFLILSFTAAVLVIRGADVIFGAEDSGNEQ